MMSPHNNHSRDPLFTSSLKDVCSLFKSLSNENRLKLLFAMADGEPHSVSELKASMHMRQATLSQQLARLRADDLVVARRSGAHVFYSIKSSAMQHLLALLLTPSAEQALGNE